MTASQNEKPGWLGDLPGFSLKGSPIQDRLRCAQARLDGPPPRGGGRRSRVDGVSIHRAGSYQSVTEHRKEFVTRSLMGWPRKTSNWPTWGGSILMVDAFNAENGATRFVPGSQLLSSEPGEEMSDPQDVMRNKSLHVVRPDRSSSSMHRCGTATVRTAQPHRAARYKLTSSRAMLNRRPTTTRGACVQRLCAVSVI
jgi:hypothetical protein